MVFREESENGGPEAQMGSLGRASTSEGPACKTARFYKTQIVDLQKRNCF